MQLVNTLKMHSHLKIHSRNLGKPIRKLGKLMTKGGKKYFLLGEQGKASY